MRILMLTNVYTPLVGGVTRSIQAIRQQLIEWGDEVLVIAPHFGDGTPDAEEGVVRMPAVPNFYQHRYAWPLPIPGLVYRTIRDFQPDLIHTHHPFLLGASGQRESILWDVPLVYTFHTQYRKCLESSTQTSQLAVDLLWSLIIAYCDLCDTLIAPSDSIAAMLVDAGIEREIVVIPTGVDVSRFLQGNRTTARRRLGIPQDAFLIGSVGRLDHEKNWTFLATACADHLRRNPKAHFLAVGDGPMAPRIREVFHSRGLQDRVHLPGWMEGEVLVDSYHAMDIFAFASHAETQGMVITEAMAAGLPVVALDAPGVRDVVIDCHNGRLLQDEELSAFSAALEELTQLSNESFNAFCEAAHRTADNLSLENCTQQIRTAYQTTIQRRNELRNHQDRNWPSPLRFLRYQWQSWSRLLEAAIQSTKETS